MKLRCDQIEKLLYLYWDDQLSRDEKGKVEEHVRTCLSCSKKLANLKLIQVEAKTRQVPDPSVDYWENFARRVKDNIEQKSKIDLAGRFSFLLGAIFSYSPAKVKWATAAVSVVLVFVVVKLFISQEQIDVTTIQQKAKVEKISTPPQAPKVETKVLGQGKDVRTTEKKKMPPPKEALPEAGARSEGQRSLAPTKEKGIQKAGTDLSVALKKEQKPSQILQEATPEIEEEGKEYVSLRAPIKSISDTPAIVLTEKSQIGVAAITASKDTLTEQRIRKYIDAHRELAKGKSRGEEKDRAYLNLAQDYARLCEIAKNKDEVLKEATDSLKTYRDLVTTPAYRDSIDSILLHLEAIHQK